MLSTTEFPLLYNAIARAGCLQLGFSAAELQAPVVLHGAEDLAVLNSRKGEKAARKLAGTLLLAAFSHPEFPSDDALEARCHRLEVWLAAHVETSPWVGAFARAGEQGTPPSAELLRLPADQRRVALATKRNWLRFTEDAEASIGAWALRRQPQLLAYLSATDQCGGEARFRVKRLLKLKPRLAA